MEHAVVIFSLEKMTNVFHVSGVLDFSHTHSSKIANSITEVKIDVFGGDGKVKVLPLSPIGNLSENALIQPETCCGRR